jgi:hypothetical protein
MLGWPETICGRKPYSPAYTESPHDVRDNQMDIPPAGMALIGTAIGMIHHTSAELDGLTSIPIATPFIHSAPELVSGTI